jgi:chromosome partitioning protein
MKTLAIMSQKGGSGKTTLAVHLAAYAIGQKVKAALIDLDPQASAYKWNERRTAHDPISPKLDLVQGTATQLAGFLKLAEDNGLTLVIIDTAPHSNSAAALVAQCADFVLMPCRPALFDLDAIASTVEIVASAETSAAVVLNAAPRGKLANEARAALEGQGITVFPSTIHQRAAYSHAVIDGRAVHEYEPEGKAAEEIAGLYGNISRKLGLYTGRRKVVA